MEKPLHVQVAEALGWTNPRCIGNRDSWEATPPPSPIEGKPGYFWGPMGGPVLIQRYDTDWSATGPLIEKYGFGTRRRPSAYVRELEVWQVDWYDHETENVLEMGGPSILVAVCNLILALKAAGKLEMAETVEQ